MNVRTTTLPKSYHDAVLRWKDAYLPDYDYLLEHWDTYFPKDRKFELCAFRELGMCDEIECGDESLLDIAMVGVGSGPALVIEFAHALTRAMVTQGMPHDLAERGILSLLKGTVELRNAALDRSLAYFQQEVVTPGGITAEALLAMEEGKFRATVINAFRRAHHKVSRLAALERGEE